ncbi:neprilysin-2-like isoform X2 [Photinus pyralis]|uniref:neprilysin-2-like isoform X2 n=1 Tax=Photinus pyralis TaxID=7054 RepID=UPI001267242A|nr:neprilysin-2-like isoform X2 [Photinus pyralis]
MPGRYNYKKDGNCWEYRTGLEKVLIAATLTAVIVVIILIVLVISISKQDKSHTTGYAIAPEPIIYANKIADIEQSIDPTVDPCEDFYKFACGNLLKRANGDENLGTFFVIQENSRRQIDEIYNESIWREEHRIVGLAKKMYKHCMNESAVEREGLQTVTDVLDKLGGWPVLKGVIWDESNFSWLQTQYLLRELGYFYSQFLTVTVETDPKNDQKFILQVSFPAFDDFGAELFEKQRFMVDVALAFGADEGRALIDIAKVLEFMLDIKREVFLRENDEPPQRVSLSEIQKRYEFINWIEFMHNIIGPSIRISIHDHILFPPLNTLKKWYDFIQNTPKRIQANYMIWKVLEKIIPNVPKLQKLQFKSSPKISRSSYCIDEVRKHFTPNPIDVMYVRRRLPLKRRDMIKKIIADMKAQLRMLVERTPWISTPDKYKIITRINGSTEIIGAPSDLFEDEIFDDMSTDWTVPKNDSYLELLSHIERSRQTWLYNQMYYRKSEVEIAKWKITTSSGIGDYLYDKNVFILPATLFQKVVFDEEKPLYFNYGSMGTLMAHHFLQLLGESSSFFDHDGNIIEPPSNLSTTLLFRKPDCLVRQLNTNVSKFMLDSLLPQALGLQLSYSAFRKNHAATMDSSIEPYSSEQLFWISAASYFCQPSNDDLNDKDLFSLLVSVPMRNNQHFGRDFNCTSGTRMNPKERCDLFV